MKKFGVDEISEQVIKGSVVNDHPFTKLKEYRVLPSPDIICWLPITEKVSIISNHLPDWVATDYADAFLSDIAPYIDVIDTHFKDRMVVNVEVTHSSAWDRQWAIQAFVGFKDAGDFDDFRVLVRLLES